MRYSIIHLWLMLFTIAAATLVYSCKDDSGGSNDQQPNASGIINFDDLSFTVTQGIIEEYGEFGENSYNFDITLFTENLTYDWNINDFRGEGSLIYFEAFTSDSTELAEGSYTFKLGGKDPFDIADGLILYKYIPVADSVVREKHIVSGGFTLKKYGDEYHIQIDCKTEDGNNINGEYKGSLQRF